MNEFLEQFLLESRELVDQATDDLLTLEGRPGDRDRVDSVFRAFHTLKGAAAIVDFDAMARALHAAEDVLSAVRGGEEPVTPALIGQCLECLDQVVRWLDAMAVDGEIPAGASAAAEAIVRGFTPVAPSSISASPPGWSDALGAKFPHGQAAVRYTPDPEAFFRGDDPLAILATIPGLLGLEVEPVAGWPALEDLDPFRCQLVLLAVTESPPATAREALLAVADQVEVLALTVEPPQSPGAAQGLLHAQVLMLQGPAGVRPGAIGSAGQVGVNVLKRLGRGAEAERLRAVAAQCQAARDPRPLVVALQDGLKVALESPGEAASTAPSNEAARTVRVDVERIDALVSLTGELLVAKNALGHVAALAQAGADAGRLAGLLKDQHASLQRLVEELQRSVLNIRVLPMRHVFQRFPRLVRELVVGLGKPARLVTEGDETEADKMIVESLYEPLAHILRNAMDHGVEPGPVRAAAGKPASATVRLRAMREGAQVVVEVEDDGGGVDVARVRTVAAERGLASPDTLAVMDDEAVVDLVFAPGFSTAAEVTSVSGRGVGMDAVRAAIQRLGGQVELQSRAGRGTTVRIRLPFAVMISRVLTVEAGGQMFGIPLDAVRETLRIDRGRILRVGAAAATVLRNRTIPVIDLPQLLGKPAEGRPDGDASLVIVSLGNQVGGLEVDRLGGRLDVMLKPLEGLLSGMPGIAGTTLLGDGRVLLVLDLQDLLP